MSNITDLSGIEFRARRLLELLETLHLTSLDFDSREHLHVICLCLDTAIEHVEKMS